MFIPIFGIGIYSVSAVVSSFMGGLALGSYICGKVIDYKKNLLKYYAFFEFLIGTYAVILPLLINVNRVTMPFFYNNISSNFYIFSIFRFIVAFLLLIAPCSLIGATLPVMSRFFIIISKKDVSSGFSFLYALNVLGAVCGCAITTFFLLYNFGVAITSYIFASINIIIGIFTFLYSFKLRFDYANPFHKLLNNYKKEKSLETHLSSKVILIVAFLCGFCVLSFELLWLRALISLVPNDVYLFPILLITILIGNSLGYFFTSTWITRVRSHSFVIGILMIISGIIITLSLRYIPFLLDKEIYSNWYIWLICPIMVLPASFVIGMIFPNLVALYSSGIKNVGHDIGNIYSINTVGSMLGSFFTAFIFMPFFGLRNTLFYSLLGYVLTGELVSIAAHKKIKQKFILIFCTLLSTVFLINQLIPKDLFKNIFIKHTSNKNEELLFYKEGVVSSMGLFKTKDFYFMRYPDKTFGRVEISKQSGAVRKNNRLKAHIPMILHKNPRLVLNIGFGTGVSAYSLTLHNNIKRIDNIEIIAETMEITPFFLDNPDKLFNNPKTNIFVDDGRNFLFKTKEKYDAILVYPYSPLYTETIYFYTKEFFQLCKSKLNKGGLVSIWFPVKLLGKEASAILVKTFLEVFPYSTFWNTRFGLSFYDVFIGGFLVGTSDKEAFSLSPDYLETRLHSLNEEVKSELIQSDIHNVRDLLSYCVADSDSLVELSKQAKEIVSDDRTILDYRRARESWSKRIGDWRGPF